MKTLLIVLLLSFQTLHAQDSVFCKAKIHINYPSSSKEIVRFDSVILREYLLGKTFRFSFRDSAHKIILDSLPPGNYNLYIRSRGYYITALRQTICSNCSNTFNANAYTSAEEIDTAYLRLRSVYPTYETGLKSLAKDFYKLLTKQEKGTHKNVFHLFRPPVY